MVITGIARAVDERKRRVCRVVLGGSLYVQLKLIAL